MTRANPLRRRFGRGDKTKVDSCCGPVELVPDEPADVVVVEGGCCDAEAAPRDAQAVQAVRQAIEAGGGDARLRVLTATEAAGGGLSAEVLAEVQRRMGDGLQAPLVLIDDEIVAGGHVLQADVASALAGR
ncbi:MAG: hypothetical protein ACRDXX_09065 [Stackebrandtia sp.]